LKASVSVPDVALTLSTFSLLMVRLTALNVSKDLNLEASKAKKTQAELDRTTRLAAYEVRQQAIREVQQANATRFEEVVYLLENTTGDFCASVANQIKRAEYHTELFNILSDRQFEIIAEIYGKALGRKNSKAYDAGVNEFHEKYGEKE